MRRSEHYVVEQGIEAEFTMGRMNMGPMDEVDIVVVGAGVIGLAIARAVARPGREVLILEAADTFGTETSSRNSEVIHAGIYYPRGSRKAQLCVAGRDLLYSYCDRHGVPYRRCGKLIVATSESQLDELSKIRAAAAANGVQLDVLSAGQVHEMEPALRCVGGLHSPLTGIIDSHGYMLSLLGEAERLGATLVCDSTVTGARIEARGVVVDVLATGAVGTKATSAAMTDARSADADADADAGVLGAESTLRARLVVNCAGIDAPAIAGRIEGFPAAHVPRAFLAKGNYFVLAGKSPFSRLVYPVPEPGGLGVHVTLDLAGRARFGPDVQWVESRDYAVDRSRGDRFYAAVRAYWPDLADGALEPAYAGIRPKISGPGEPNADFRIDGPATHGVASVINLFGIESPGLTASLAIASEVAAMADQALR